MGRQRFKLLLQL